ncbi:hypothetical protein FBEOM_4952 [Fusarium beomiforme]|uniref:Uncharacterized protein n=1 Tax=Fusarium beomiforme TaxID=44412 RepID=A0A9P5DXK6_9HYPO|nr:hypothetical protein FBEOM_4952 [Fusarium beomiforme]
MDEAINTKQAADPSQEHLDAWGTFEHLKHDTLQLNRKPEEPHQGTNSHSMAAVYPSSTAYPPAFESSGTAIPLALDTAGHLLKRGYGLEQCCSLSSRNCLPVPGIGFPNNRHIHMPSGKRTSRASNPVDSSPSRCSPCGPHLNASGKRLPLGTTYPSVYIGYDSAKDTVCKSPGVESYQLTPLPSSNHKSSSPSPISSAPIHQEFSRAKNTGPYAADSRKRTRNLDRRVEQSGIYRAKEAKSAASSKDRVKTDGSKKPDHSSFGVSTLDDMGEDPGSNFDSGSEVANTPCSFSDDEEFGGLLHDIEVAADGHGETNHSWML